LSLSSRWRLANRRLNREIQTVFLMTGMRWIYTSSSIIKEAAQFGGDVKGMVPQLVLERLTTKFSQPATPR
jgi:pantetheine-phosphate adenylyltransferase